MTSPATTSSPLVATSSLSMTAMRSRAARGELFAILDACEEPRIPLKIQELTEEQVVSLYRGGAEEGWWAFAPYLARVDVALLDWIVDKVWREPWGIFVLAERPLEELRRHLRKFLVVEAPNGEQWYFRFYDPRVLRPFLETSVAAELHEFYGPVQAYGIGRSADVVALFHYQPFGPR